jgi:hypothetical protein
MQEEAKLPSTTSHPSGGSGLLEATIILMLSVALMIFVVSMTGKFLGDDNFERLPDFIRDSYTALFSLVTVGGLSGLMAWFQSRRGSQTSTLRYLLYTLGVLLVLCGLIGAAVAFAPSPMERLLQPPPQTVKLDVTRAEATDASFSISNTGVGGMRAELTGTISYTRQRIKGRVDGGSVTLWQLPGYDIPRNWRADHVAINVCHYSVQNGPPVPRFDPDAIVQGNSISVDWDFAKKPGETFTVPAFDFDFATPSVDFPKIAWLCATITSKSRSFLAIVQ